MHYMLQLIIVSIVPVASADTHHLSLDVERAEKMQIQLESICKKVRAKNVCVFDKNTDHQQINIVQDLEFVSHQVSQFINQFNASSSDNSIEKYPRFIVLNAKYITTKHKFWKAIIGENSDLRWNFWTELKKERATSLIELLVDLSLIKKFIPSAAIPDIEKEKIKLHIDRLREEAKKVGTEVMIKNRIEKLSYFRKAAFYMKFFYFRITGPDNAYEQAVFACPDLVSESLKHEFSATRKIRQQLQVILQTIP